MVDVEVLGELRAMRDDAPVELPTSRKTRALLGYLVVTRRAHARSRLCELLWDEAEDPRGALRWSLSRLRRAVGSDALQTDRTHVAWKGAPSDLDALRALARDPGAATPDAVRRAVDRVRGELLEGTDLPAHLTWQSWLSAERDAAHGLHQRLLEHLWGALDDPDAAVEVARRWVRLEPLSEAPHAALARSLAALGRTGEAFEQLERCRALFREELGIQPTGATVQARRELAAARPEPSERSRPSPAAPSDGVRAGRAPFVGREEAIESARSAAEALSLVVGEPGIGKSRLLDRVADELQAAGWRVLRGAGFEAEQVRAWGPWVDALASVSERPASLEGDLGPLTGVGASETDQNRLFRATLALLRHLAPVAVVLDDLHWADGSSLALLHYVARSERDGVRLFAGARPTELAERPEVAPILESLRRTGRLRRIALGPLDAASATELARALVPAGQVAALVERAAGSPLVLVELARGGDELLASLEQRIARLPDGAQQLASWSAALGASITVDRLESALDVELEVLLERLETLERHRVLRPREDGYVFAHDLLRQAAYRRLSGPRRQLVHRQLARALSRTGAPAHEVAQQASLGGEHRLAATSFAAAASRSLAQIAPAEAIDLARRGLGHLERLADPSPHEQRDLLRPLIFAVSSLQRAPLPDTDTRLEALLEGAERMGDAKLVTEAHYLQSLIHEDRGAIARAAQTTLAAADSARRADPVAAARQLSNTARCLLTLETEVPTARVLLDEAAGLVRDLEIEEPELEWGRGLLARWDGDAARAADRLQQAARLVGRAGDVRNEGVLVADLATVALESGDAAACVRWCRDLAKLAARLGEGTAGPLAQGLSAIADGDGTGLDAALAELVRLDAQSDLALVHNLAAGRRLVQGELDLAERHARSAIEAAAVSGRTRSDVLARIHLARVALARDDAPAAVRWLGPARVHLDVEDALDQVTARELRDLVEAADRESGS